MNYKNEKDFTDDLRVLTRDTLNALKIIHEDLKPLLVGRYLNSEELCRFLSIKPSLMRKMIFEKKIPHTKVGRLLRFDKNEIEDWLQANSVK